MKKICSIILAMILIITPILQVSAYDIINEKKIAVKNILLTKSQLKKITKWEQYITAMDNFIAKIKNNQKKLNSIEYKLSTAINNIKSKQWAWITLSKKDSNLLKILSYTQARITFIQLDNLQKIEETWKEKLTKILEQVKNPDISQLDKEKLEDTVIKIQKKLLDQSKLTVNNIMWDFEEYWKN